MSFSCVFKPSAHFDVLSAAVVPHSEAFFFSGGLIVMVAAMFDLGGGLKCE